MSRWAWIIPTILIVAVMISLARRTPPTFGERLLSDLESHHLPTREALLLIDYSPDRELLNAARINGLSQGLGAAPGLGLQPAVVANQHWIRCEDATLYYPTTETLRASLPAAAERLQQIADDQLAITAALDQLQKRSDEKLFLDWLHADRGVLAELNNPTAAAAQALLLLARQNPGPVLAFTIGTNHVYLLPDAPTPDATWCTLAAFDQNEKQLWTATLRLDNVPPPEHVRAMAVFLAQEALKSPATDPTLPEFLHY
ncbi:MAG TPA: hypothetical protein VM008_12595 [Phycisphaerae bacterium]|nr:hypothetical protein [Phycisphaerae bacterium]